MSYSKEDLAYMAQCLELASRGEGNTAPNPMVGAIVVDPDSNVIGTGYHMKAGLAHAEVNALGEAKSLAKGATIYVSMEPCCHYGKTPPCTKAIIDAGIKKVVIAAGDPNPKVNGKGVESLLEHGIEVSIGILEEDANWLNRGFIKRVTKNLPWVSLKLASTLDGRIADRYGNSKWITGTLAREYVQSLRKKSDCILVGAGTIRADNPRLNVREKNVEKHPYRAVIDPKLTIEPNSNFLNCEIGGHSLVYFLNNITNDKIEQLNNKTNVSMIPIASKPMPNIGASLNLEEILCDMASRGINSVLCEGGSRLASNLLLSGFVDEIYWFIAPKFLPDSNALTSISGESAVEIENIVNFKSIESQQFGEDTLLHLKK